MQIRCNGEMREVVEGMTVAGLIAEFGLEPDLVVAELDGRILGRGDYDDALLHEGAELELIRFVGGG